MIRKRTRWNKLGRFASGFVVLCFFLPFFGVSCDGLDVVTISGADMVGGCKPGGMLSEATERRSQRSSEGGLDIDSKTDTVSVEPIAIVALALALGGFAAAWYRSRRAMTASLGLAVATFAVLVALFVKVGGALDEAVAAQTASSTSSSIGRDMKVDAGSRWGLWLACLSLIGVAVMTTQALREKDDPSAPPPIS